MKIVFFAHPSFLGSQSMPRFANMLFEGMKGRGHEVQLWAPQSIFFRFPFSTGIRKWMGYIDQYCVFPTQVKDRLKRCPSDTLFVFTDHALGPWVPLVANRSHVIHCHDFLAQRSAQKEIPENLTGWSGSQYQNFIRRGYSSGRNFISVSQKTRDDLHRFLPISPLRSEVVYNGLNPLFVRCNSTEARNSLGRKISIDLSQGYLLHVGGNQWYKNRIGVIEIFNAYSSKSKIQIPLLLIGAKPSEDIMKVYDESPFKNNIHFITELNDESIHWAYAGASIFLFPSLAEGFGWPIAEAMASGCPVITTNEAPMTEVSGNAAFLIPRRPNGDGVPLWAAHAAEIIKKILDFTLQEREAVIETGIKNSRRFSSKIALDKIESIYMELNPFTNRYQLSSV